MKILLNVIAVVLILKPDFGFSKEVHHYSVSNFATESIEILKKPLDTDSVEEIESLENFEMTFDKSLRQLSVDFTAVSSDGEVNISEVFP